MPSWEKSCPANLCQSPHCLNECAKLWRQADGVSVYQTLEWKTTEGTLRDKNLKCSELSKGALRGQTGWHNKEMD